MHDFPIDVNEFLLTVPAWALFDTTHVTEGRGLGIVEARGKDKRRCPLLFTDLDQAERFVTRLGHPAILPHRLDTPGDLVDFLRVLIRRGHRDVGVDPPEQDHVPMHIFAIDSVIKRAAEVQQGEV
jgi:hypothetical protein